MSEQRPKAPKPVGNRVVRAMRKVLAASSNGGRLPAVQSSPTPNPPSYHLREYQPEAERMVRQHLGLGPEEPLGAWVVPEDHYEATGGKSEYVKFNRFWRDWMEDHDAESLANLTFLSKFTPAQLKKLEEIVLEEIERDVKRKIWKNAWAWGAFLCGSTFTVVRYGAEAFNFVRDHIGAMQGVWQWLARSIT